MESQLTSLRTLVGHRHFRLFFDAHNEQTTISYLSQHLDSSITSYEQINARSFIHRNENWAIHFKWNGFEYQLVQAKPCSEKDSKRVLPRGRLEREFQLQQFYQQNNKSLNYLPKAIHYDRASQIILYKYPQGLKPVNALNLRENLGKILHKLSKLHQSDTPPEYNKLFWNKKMRELRSENLFGIFLDFRTKFPQNSELKKKIARLLYQNNKFSQRLKQIRKFYLENGPSLIHGDLKIDNISLGKKSVVFSNLDLLSFGSREFDLATLFRQLSLRIVHSPGALPVQSSHAEPGFDRS